MGPNWVWEMYQSASGVSPNPVTGRCPQPRSDSRINRHSHRNRVCGGDRRPYDRTRGSAGDYDRLYAWMHPDSQAIVPEEAMEGWYREVFANDHRVWMTVDDVRLVEWTWEVTGRSIRVPPRCRSVSGSRMARKPTGSSGWCATTASGGGSSAAIGPLSRSRLLDSQASSRMAAKARHHR